MNTLFTFELSLHRILREVRCFYRQISTLSHSYILLMSFQTATLAPLPRHYRLPLRPVRGTLVPRVLLGALEPRYVHSVRIQCGHSINEL